MAGTAVGRSRYFDLAVTVAVVLGIGIGLAQSLELVFHLWGADSDIADPVLLWNGVHRDGLQFVTMWRYTQDNWLLSLMPIDAALFALFGDRPVVVVASGLLFFWVITLLVGVLVGRDRGFKIGALSTMVLLFAGQPAIGNAGFLGYAVSHNISLVWGLIGLLSTTLWLDRSRIIFLGAAGVCLFIAAVSDPWADAAFVIPIALASLVLAIEGPMIERRRFIAIGAMVLVVGLLVQTRLFGVLWFLPRASHSLATLPGMVQNGAFAARYIAVFLNIIPGSFTDTTSLPPTVAVIADCAVFAAIVLVCLVRLKNKPYPTSGRSRFIALTALASILGMLAALVITGFQQGIITGRYLSNLFVFLPILLAASPIGVGRHGGFDRAIVVCLGGLFIASGIASAATVWTDGMPRTSLRGIPHMAAVLRSHGVRFGYGPYWWTQANATTWVTRGGLTIRPFDFNPNLGKFVPKPVQTLPAWYSQATIAHEPSRMALILSPSPGDCGAATTCMAAAVAQFGEPAEIVPYGPLTVLIYDHRLYLDPR
jgi:hypothetical protein